MDTGETNSKPRKPKKRKKSADKSATKKLLASDLSVKILGDRRRCDKLQSLQEEFFIVSMINVLLAQGKVLHHVQMI